MSGPKVIDVVTRQELLDICRTAIAEVDHALVEWQRIMDRNMIDAPAELGRLVEARDGLRGLLASERFRDVQTRAPEVTAAVRSSVQQQLTAQAREAAAKQRREASLRFSAEAVLARCREMNIELPAECVRVLSDAAAASPANSEAVTLAISQATAALYVKAENGPSKKQHEIAHALGATGDTASATDLLGRAQELLLDPRILRMSTQIVELGEVGEVDAAAACRSRLDKANQAEARGDLQHRNLLLDSLEIELAPLARKAQLTRELQHELGVETAAAQATNDWDACRSDLEVAKAALQLGDPDSARLSLDRARAHRQERHKQRAAQSSRAAILDGLKTLGYEVREGMATQWTEKKQLVVRHAAKPGVALELAGTLDGGRLQARMVALEETVRDPHADKKTEEQWCSELESLEKHIADRGGEVTVVKAVAAGVTPMKVVANENLEDESRERRRDARESKRSP
jgi:hypothetical protein